MFDGSISTNSAVLAVFLHAIGKLFVLFFAKILIIRSLVGASIQLGLVVPLAAIANKLGLVIRLEDVGDQLGLVVMLAAIANPLAAIADELGGLVMLLEDVGDVLGLGMPLTPLAIGIGRRDIGQDLRI